MKINFILFCVIVVKVAASIVPEDDLFTSQLKIRIAAAQKRVALASRDAGIQMGLARDAISIEIERKIKNLNTQLDALEDLVQRAKFQSTYNFSNHLEECITAEEARLGNEFDLGILEYCRETPGFKHFGVLISQLGEQEANLRHMIPRCKVLSEKDDEKLLKCVEKELYRITHSVLKTHSETFSTISKISDEATKCLNKGEKQLKLTLDNIGKSFQLCINKNI